MLPKILALLLLATLPLSADTLTELSFRMLAPEQETGSATKLYRYQDTHFRLERGEWLAIHRGFDIWNIDLETNQAEYSTDPDGKTKVWIFPPEDIPSEFHDLEFGYETKFIEEHPFGVVGEEQLENESCRILQWAQPNGTVRFWVNSDNLPVQLEMSDKDDVIFRIRYESYRLTPLQETLFQLPAGLTVVVDEQALPSSSALYEPWLGDTIRGYGSKNFIRFAKSLAEDLPPTLEQLTTPFDPWRALSDSELDALDISLRSESDPSVRGRIYRTLAAHGRKESLRYGLFDNYHSNRWLCMELLQEPASDMTLLLPSRPLNVFHFKFLEGALERRLPKQSPSEFFALPSAERAQRVSGADLRQYLALARKEKSRPLAAAVLFLFGTSSEQSQATEVIRNELIQQGDRPDVYHGSDFWLRGDLLMVLSNHPRPEELGQLFRQTLAEYSKENEMFLLALAYALDYSEASVPGVAEDLSRVKDLSTDNYDLYLAAALALSRQDPVAGKESLLHVLSLQRQPFATMAILRLEKLTGKRTPGWGESDLHPDPEAALKFWSQTL